MRRYALEPRVPAALGGRRPKMLTPSPQKKSFTYALTFATSAVLKEKDISKLLSRQSMLLPWQKGR